MTINRKDELKSVFEDTINQSNLALSSAYFCDTMY